MLRLTFFAKLRWLHLLAAVGVAALVYFAVQRGMGPQLTAERVVRRDFVQTLVASGRVESPHRVDIGVQMTGTVQRVPVQEGQSIARGTVLIELQDAELKALERQADIAVAQAQARLRQLAEVQAPVAQQALRQAQVNLGNAQAALQRSENLFKQGFIGQAALDESRRATELADAQWRSAQKQAESTHPSGSDYALAVSAVDAARAQAEAARARAKYAVVKAPVDGVLIGRNVEVGDVVQPGKVLMTLSPKGKTQLVIAIDEKNLHLIALGQKALVSADAYPQRKFAAELVYINPGVNAQTGAVEVKLDVAQPPDILRQDMTVSVDIEVARRPAALLLPVSTVHDADGKAPWVLRVDGGRAVKVPVQLGLRSGGWVELLEGLQEDDAALPANAPVGAGDRVRLQAAAQ